MVTDGLAGAYDVAVAASRNPVKLSVAHMAFIVSFSANVNKDDLDITFVALLSCKDAMIVEPGISEPLMFGQNLKFTVDDDVLLICAENEIKYKPGSSMVIVSPDTDIPSAV